MQGFFEKERAGVVALIVLKVTAEARSGKREYSVRKRGVKERSLRKSAVRKGALALKERSAEEAAARRKRSAEDAAMRKKMQCGKGRAAKEDVIEKLK